MLTSVLDVQKDLAAFAAVLFFCSLFAVPPPGVFAFTPLKPLSAVGPFAVDANVQAVVFKSN